ncbi:MAG: right-handed parallel beta-helix repeat-containing protein [Rikenellaceae bacterium]
MRKISLLFMLLLVFTTSLSARVWHISPNGSDLNDGSVASPLRTISKAAFHALAGDTVLIGEGVYRERVSPANSGFNDKRRITYMAAEGEEVWIKGSEVVTGWKKLSKDVWEVKIPNSMFGDFNPYSVEIYGDWYLEGHGLHLGEVYINGSSLQEYLSDEEVAQTKMSWITSVDDEQTIIRANFGGENPNKALTEINVRAACFFPETTGINYITVKGLKIAQAATQWAPPTGEQPGMVGPNWSKGWVIEDCEILQSKCVGISIGKSRASGHNLHSLYLEKSTLRKMGFTRELEAIFKAYELGWSEENVGSHLIQNNKIYECDQAGIVGHLGCIFTTIRGNEIYDINMNTPMMGHETGGIKVHAGIDMVIEGNCITGCNRGVWIDWQAQGMHIRDNIMANNVSEDLFIEVSHGPTLVYNNILLSDKSLRLRAQGIAFFNNLIEGYIDAGSSAANRYTPYHAPHSTAIMGLFNNPGGDWHFYNNIFLCEASDSQGKVFGLEGCKDYPALIEEYIANRHSSAEGTENLTKKLPMFLNANVYIGSEALPHHDESGYTHLKDKSVKITLEKREDGRYYLDCDMDFNFNTLKEVKTVGVNTDMLGDALIPELLYENVDKSEFIFAKDYFGRDRGVDAPFVGPFEGAFDISQPIW